MWAGVVDTRMMLFSWEDPFFIESEFRSVCEAGGV